MIKSLLLIQGQYMSQRKQAVTPFTKKKQLNKPTSILSGIDDTMEGVFANQLKNQEKDDEDEDHDVGVFQQQSGNSLRLLFNKLALEVQQKPKVSTILISYLICVLYHLLNPHTISKFYQNNQIENHSQLEWDKVDQSQSSDDTITYIIFQLLAQDFFIFSSVRLFFHDRFLRKIEVKDLLISFWFTYWCCTILLLSFLVIITSHWINMLIFSACYCFLMFQYKKEQNSVKNLFQMSLNFEQLLRNQRRGVNAGEEENQNEHNEEENQNDQQQTNQQNGNQGQAGDGNDSDEHEENNHREAVRLNTRRSNANPRVNPIVTELVQQFIGEHYERNQVSQLIQIGIQKWLVIYKVNYIKYACVYFGKARLFTQKIDNNCIVLKYYWDSIAKPSSPYSNEEVKKKYINLGIMYNSFTGKLMIFTVHVKGIKYLSLLDIGIVNKDHIVLHQQLPKFVTIRLKDLLFRDLIKNEMSSQTLVDYPNRVLQAYYYIDDTDYVISIEEESLIISSILSQVEWKPVGHDWEMELMNGNHPPSNNLSHAQNALLKNQSFYDKKQYFIQQKTKVKDFPTNIKCVNILNKRHLFVQDETHFYVYSIPTSQILQTLPNNYVQGFSIIPINSTILSPNLTIDQFLKLQKYTQKQIADSLAKHSNLSNNSAITTENPALIYLAQYTSIPITFYKSEKSTTPSIYFIAPKQIQSTTPSAIQTENLFQIQSSTLQNILDSANL